jgi:two-component system, chemotaxis family, chemotaxis protein CheY
MGMISHPPRLATRSLRVLYAEDLHELRDLARLAFTRDGHRVECAVDGLAALERLTADPSAFDLLITDHHMPRMTGLELVYHVRSLPFCGKIMVFSSELNPAVTADYHKLNVDRILFKPVLPSGLRDVIAELFPADASGR